MPKKELSIVIPFYNDVGCVKPFVKGLKKELEGINYELILVDDYSIDTTPQELDKLADKRVHVVHNKKNMDYGGAIMAGLKNSQGKIVGFTCGDGEVTPEDIVYIYKKMNEEEVTKAIRIERLGFIRKILSKSFNLFSNWRFRLGLIDINGYPVFMKKEIYQTLPKMRTDWLFNLDLFLNLAKKKCKIREITVKHKERLSGKSHMVPLRIIIMIPKFFRYCLK